jgi:hypothetical protein
MRTWRRNALLVAERKVGLEAWLGATDLPPPNHLHKSLTVFVVAKDHAQCQQQHTHTAQGATKRTRADA